MQTNLFGLHFELLNGVFFTSVDQKSNFKVMHGHLDDNKWNLIVPETKINDLDWNDVEKSISKEKLNKDFSIYVPSDLNTHYSASLVSKDYSMISVDTLVERPIDGNIAVKLSKDEVFERLEKSDYPAYIKQVSIIFSQSNTQESYAKAFLEFGNKKNDKELVTFVIKKNKQIISFCSVIYCKKSKLAYINNGGTDEKYRKKGYFSKLINSVMNYLNKEKITRVYAMVEQGKETYTVFKKIDFMVNDYYYMYAKVIS